MGGIVRGKKKNSPQRYREHRGRSQMSDRRFVVEKAEGERPSSGTPNIQVSEEPSPEQKAG
jgi:hypothetical protein